MKTYQTLSLFLLFIVMNCSVWAQVKDPVSAKPKVEVYYFHPNERCPIDEAIEANTIKLMQTDFAKEVSAGLLKLSVVNTDNAENNALAEQFEINTQALYIVRNEEDKVEKTNLTDFAFANAKNNPAKFMDRVKEEVLNALK